MSLDYYVENAGTWAACQCSTLYSGDAKNNTEDCRCVRASRLGLPVCSMVPFEAWHGWPACKYTYMQQTSPYMYMYIYGIWTCMSWSCCGALARNGGQPRRTLHPASTFTEIRWWSTRITQGEAAAMRDWWAESRDFYYSASAQTIITCGIVEKYLKIQENQSVIRLHLPLVSTTAIFLRRPQKFKPSGNLYVSLSQNLLAR